MVTLENAVVARYRSHGENFEILVDPEGAYALRSGRDVDISSILAVDSVFQSVSSGARCSEDSLMKVFGTTDVYEIARKIIMKGEVQLTSEQRRKLLERRRKEVVDTIVKNAINPQTGAPHPPQRIEQAMEEAKVHIDPFKSLDECVKQVLEAIKPIIPIRFEEVEIAVKIPPAYAAKCYGSVASFGKIVREEWQNDGSWICVVKIPAGMQVEFYEKLNKLTKGEAQTKLLRGDGGDRKG